MTNPAEELICRPLFERMGWIGSDWAWQISISAFQIVVHCRRSNFRWKISLRAMAFRFNIIEWPIRHRYFINKDNFYGWLKWTALNNSEAAQFNPPGRQHCRTHLVAVRFEFLFIGKCLFTVNFGVEKRTRRKRTVLRIIEIWAKQKWESTVSHILRVHIQLGKEFQNVNVNGAACEMCLWRGKRAMIASSASTRRQVTIKRRKNKNQQIIEYL